MDIADLDADPMVEFQRWLDVVVATPLPEPMAMILSTAPAGEQAQPSGRHVLLRGVDHRGFAFVTNRQSRKGGELAANPRACLVFPWFPIGRQVVVTGTVTQAPDDESDAYFASRPRGSQLAAWASDQSRPIPDRAVLEQRWHELDLRYADEPVPRPPHWGMQWLTPAAIEFWRQGEYRLHDRLRYERAGDGWVVTRLAP